MDYNKVTSNYHVHNYIHSYATHTITAHKAYCSCGEFVYESHDFITRLGKTICKHCGYATMGTVPDIMGFVDDSTKKRCNQIYFLIKEDN